MNIVYKHFRIECEGKSFTLFSSEKGKEKLEGYFTNVYSAMKRIHNLLLGTKKVKNPPDKELIEMLQKHNRISKKLLRLSNRVYKPIHKLDEQVNGIRKI